MKIAAIAHAIPSRPVTNDDVVEILRAENRDHFDARQLEQLERTVRGYFNAAGTDVRYYLGDGETATQFLTTAARKALADADTDPKDVDFVIYTGVSRGWVEPATAPLVQAEIGLPNAVCFDVLEACCGWLRALQIAHCYMATRTYGTGLIVNCECGLGAQAGWRFEKTSDIEHRIAAFTIGEAATATVVCPSDDDDFHFGFRSIGEHLGLCIVPLPGVGMFHPNGPDRRHVPNQLFSMSRELVDVVSTNIIDLFRADSGFDGSYEVFFGHEVSETVCRRVGEALGHADVYFPTHRRFGNTVSASVPLGMSVAIDEGRLQRGDRVLVVVGASGVSVGLARFTY